MVELDGSMGEGGGQILRSSLTLSLLTGKSFHLRHIRAGRTKPGLQPQHLMSVRAAGTIGQAKVRGDRQGSQELVFEPGKIQAGNYRFEIGTAGATGLVLQTLALPLALDTDAPSTLTITGGTHTTTAPCFHFLDVTWRAYLEHLGMRIRMRMVRPGFYPRGGGEIEVQIQPCPAALGFTAGRAGPVRITGFSAIAGLPDHVARRQARRAVNRLRDQSLEAHLHEETWEGGPGSVLALVVDTTPAPVLFFGLGARGKPAESVADEAVDALLGYLGRRREGETELVDPHSADQLVLPLALARPASDFAVAEVTPHLLTNLGVLRAFLDREIVCEGEEGKIGRVRMAPQS